MTNTGGNSNNNSGGTTSAAGFQERIAQAAADKKSAIVLALDPPSPPVATVEASSRRQQLDLVEYAKEIINEVEQHVCAIKLNFHMILPLSSSEISAINRLAHSYGLQSIADIKLNDIENTNEVAVTHLARMGFDAVIANPFMGKDALAALVRYAHKMGTGVIALVYMSHPGAVEGYGLEVFERGGSHDGSGDKRAMYKMFLERANRAQADGIVVGATQIGVLREIAKEKKEQKEKQRNKMAMGMAITPPIYCPGVGTQGGDIEQVVKSGVDYLIIGRLILQSDNPASTAREIQVRILSVRK